MKLLLVNPPIYDFTAFDFWLRPYGLLRVAGRLRTCDLTGFDYLVSRDRDEYGRGRFDRQLVTKPAPLSMCLDGSIGLLAAHVMSFDGFSSEQFDVVLVQTVMTYWYLGVREVIEDVRTFQPHARIILGGVYATLSPAHASQLGADLVLSGLDLNPLELPLTEGLPFWESVDASVGVLKITEGCPFRCTYCSVPLVYPHFEGRPLESCIE